MTIEAAHDRVVPLAVFAIIVGLAAVGTAVTFLHPHAIFISIFMAMLWLWPLAFYSWLESAQRVPRWRNAPLIELAPLVILPLVAILGDEYLPTSYTVGLLLIVSLFPLALPTSSARSALRVANPRWCVAAGIACGLAGVGAQHSTVLVVGMFASFGFLGSFLAYGRFKRETSS
jgi:hypothetical protein